MSTVRAVLLAVLVTVGMAACSSAFAGIQWQGSMDDARRNAGAFMVSPQGKVSGLVYSLDPVANGWKLNRSGTALQQQPFPLTQGAYSPLRPASQYGITGKPAVIDVPVSVTVPGKSSTVPGRIIEPVNKATLSRIATKALKVLPVLSTAYGLSELLAEAGLLFRDSQYYQLTQSEGTYGRVTGFIWVVQDVYTLGTFYSPDAACLAAYNRDKSNPNYTVTGTGQPLYQSSTSYVCQYDVFRKSDGVKLSGQYGARLLTQGNYTSCTGYIYVGNDGTCFQRAPANEVPLTDDAAASLLDQKASSDKLINVINDLPNDPNVIDVVARELQDDPADHQFRWPSGTPSIQIGDPVTTTTTNPDGSSKTQTTTTTATVNGDQVTFTTQTTTTTYSPTGQPTGTTTTTTTPTDPSNPNSTQQEDLECGLPGKPPCKIDEAGTPEPPVNDAETTIRDLFSEWQACIDDIQACLPQLPDISWTFSLPSGCSPIPLPGFEKWGLSAVDICPYQPMIHNLMSMLWAAAGLFGAISIISRRRTSE